MNVQKLFCKVNGHLFIPDIYIAPLQETCSEALSAKAKKRCLKKLAKRRHIVPGQQAQHRRELIPGRGANHRECSTLFKRRAGPRNQELTTSRRTKSSQEAKSETGLQRSVY